MQLNLIETEFVKKKITEEIQSLTMFLNSAPEGIKAEVQALIGTRQSALDAIKAEIANVVVTVPVEAEATAQQYITTQPRP